MRMITSSDGKLGETINALANEGKIAPVSFTAPDGVRRKANSCHAAHDWMKEQGFFQRDEMGWIISQAPIVYHV